MGIGMDEHLKTVLAILDYIVSYWMLKLARTLLLSTLILLVILFVRKMWDVRRRRDDPLSGLYVKAYLWLVLLPVPFMGGLKLSFEHFPLRNHLYVAMYEFLMTHKIVGRLYFAGVLVVAAIMVCQKIRLHFWIRRLPVYCGEGIGAVRQIQMAGVQIRTTSLYITPFTSGICKRVIVVPDYMVEQFDAGELDRILQHEYCHIKRGHLLVYCVLDLFRVLWFANPLVHLAARQIKIDLEMICDNAVIRNNTYNPERYGMTLLKAMTFLQAGSKEEEARKEVPAFVGETSFAVMKKRIQMIAGYREFPGRYLKSVYVLSGVFVILVFFLGKLSSYPAYTPYTDYGLYSFDCGRRIFSENEEFNAAVEKTESGLVVDNEKVKALLRDAQVDDTGDYWLYYGGYMKMPGIGGGGDVLYYSTAGQEGEMAFLPYNERDPLASFAEWILQHV